MECLGCRIAHRIEPDVHVVYENQYLSVVLDIAPFNEGHILILPKNHYHDLEEIDEITLTEIMKASVGLSRKLKKVFNPDGITICQNGGIFNDLGHYHMHLIPRYKHDGFSWSEPIIDHKAGSRLKETQQKLVKEEEME